MAGNIPGSDEPIDNALVGNDDAEENSPEQGQSKEKQREAKGVNSVTNYVSEESGAIDSAAMAEAVNSLSTTMDSVLKSNTIDSAIVIKEEDIKLIMDECDVVKETAEEMLRSQGGDVKKTMLAYIKR